MFDPEAVDEGTMLETECLEAGASEDNTMLEAVEELNVSDC